MDSCFSHLSSLPFPSVKETRICSFRSLPSASFSLPRDDIVPIDDVHDIAADDDGHLESAVYSYMHSVWTMSLETGRVLKDHEDIIPSNFVFSVTSPVLAVAQVPVDDVGRTIVVCQNGFVGMLKVRTISCWNIKTEEENLFLHQNPDKPVSTSGLLCASFCRLSSNHPSMLVTLHFKKDQTYIFTVYSFKIHRDDHVLTCDVRVEGCHEMQHESLKIFKMIAIPTFNPDTATVNAHFGIHIALATNKGILIYRMTPTETNYEWREYQPILEVDREVEWSSISMKESGSQLAGICSCAFTGKHVIFLMSITPFAYPIVSSCIDDGDVECVHMAPDPSKDEKRVYRVRKNCIQVYAFHIRPEGAETSRHEKKFGSLRADALIDTFTVGENVHIVVADSVKLPQMFMTKNPRKRVQLTERDVARVCDVGSPYIEAYEVTPCRLSDRDHEETKIKWGTRERNFHGHALRDEHRNPDRVYTDLLTVIYCEWKIEPNVMPTICVVIEGLWPPLDLPNMTNIPSKRWEIVVNVLNEHGVECATLEPVRLTDIDGIRTRIYFKGEFRTSSRNIRFVCHCPGHHSSTISHMGRVPFEWPADI